VRLRGPGDKRPLLAWPSDGSEGTERDAAADRGVRTRAFTPGVDRSVRRSCADPVCAASGSNLGANRRLYASDPCICGDVCARAESTLLLRPLFSGESCPGVDGCS